MESVICMVCWFLPYLYCRVVHLVCSNSTVVSYIKQEGRTKSFQLTHLTIRLLKLCGRKSIVLIPVYIPGIQNVHAGTLTCVCQTLLTEWSINRHLLLPVFSWWGTLWIDLCATYDNKKCMNVWIIPSFRIWYYVLHDEHVPSVITDCTTSVSRPFSSLNCSLGLAGGKHYQKITNTIFRHVVQNVTLPGCFPNIIFYRYISPYCLLVGLLLQFMALFKSREPVMG